MLVDFHVLGRERVNRLALAHRPLICIQENILCSPISCKLVVCVTSLIMNNSQKAAGIGNCPLLVFDACFTAGDGQQVVIVHCSYP